MSNPVVGFAGMTHLGLNSAIAAAARGFETIGFDTNADLVARLQKREWPVVEPDLDKLAREHATRLKFSALDADLAKCDVVYISTDVATDDDGKSDLAPVEALIGRVAPLMNDAAILVVLCQVPPGFTRGIRDIPPARLFYQVETLIFGRAMERAMYPERYIIGAAQPADPLPAPFRSLLEAYGCPILPMRYESAELAKISINFCLVASIGVANTLAEISEAIGADWSEIVPALKLDKRIGQYSYLAPGLGISGGNLERDLRTVLNISGAKGTDGGIIEAWLANSKHRKDWCWRVLQAAVLTKTKSPRIAVLGLAYKENTHSTKNSPSLQLLSHLTAHNVCVHDPVVDTGIAAFARRVDSPMDCVKDADVLVIATPWPEYRVLKATNLAGAMRGRVLIDPYRILDANAAAAAGFEYYTLGMPALAPR